MHRFVRPFTVVAFAVAALAQQPPTFRLPDAVKPLHYGAELTVVPAQDTFSGTIDIALSVQKSTPVIWLNATDLSIQAATLTVGGASTEARVLPGGDDFVGLAFGKPLELGGARLHIVYSGKIGSRSSAGVFKNHVAGDWYAFTQFEPTDARRAFPCFDEPSFKVPWQLTLHVKQEHMALSNTPVLTETPEPGGMKAVRFKLTRPLPSYLIAFAVGPFDAVDAGHAGLAKVPMRIITPHGMADQAAYAAKVTPQLLETLETYFGIPYPYEKLDSIAVPLFGGAMENAGLITYDQGLILAKPSEDSLRRQRDYASVAAHEMAHMWVGDLVTTAWWDDLWLNEAFATWMSEKTLETWKPEWHSEISAAAAREVAMNADSLVSARQIRQPVHSNGDIANAFDAITYQKGAAVIYMFEHWLGPETFRAGVRLYLSRHLYGNATASDLLSALSEAAKRDIAPAFSTFLDQPGVPLLSGAADCGAQPPKLALSQQRFLPLGSKAPTSERWRIPVCARYSGGGHGDFCAPFDEASGGVAFPAGAGCPSWLLLNDADAGYYRVLYRGGMLDRVIASGGKMLSPAERVGIVGDVRALFRGGQLPAGETLRTAAEFANDPSREVVSSSIDVVEGIGRNLVSPSLEPNYRRFVRKVYGARARALGWTPKPGESDDASLLRPELVRFVAVEGDEPELSAAAGHLASTWLRDRSGIAPGMLGAVLETAAVHGGRPLYDRMTAELSKVRSPAERRALLGAIGAFRDPAIVKANFALLLKGEVDLREGRALLLAPLRTAATRALPFDLVRDNYDQLVSTLPSGGMGEMAARLPVIGSAFCDDRRRGEVEAFFKDRVAKTTGGERILAQILESIDQCIAIRKAQEPGVAQFLRSH
jgi:alanyl aminopeptidase